MHCSPVRLLFVSWCDALPKLKKLPSVTRYLSEWNIPLTAMTETDGANADTGTARSFETVVRNWAQSGLGDKWPPGMSGHDPALLRCPGDPRQPSNSWFINMCRRGRRTRRCLRKVHPNRPLRSGCHPAYCTGSTIAQEKCSNLRRSTCVVHLVCCSRAGWCAKRLYVIVN